MEQARFFRRNQRYDVPERLDLDRTALDNHMRDPQQSTPLTHGSYNIAPSPGDSESSPKLLKKQRQRSHRPTTYWAALCLSSIVILIGTAPLWEDVATHQQGWEKWYEGRPIETLGHMSQIVAKTIDTIYSAIIAPVIMLSLEAIWFAIAQVAAANDKGSKPIPLASLVVTSSTAGGSLSVFSIRQLWSGRNWRLRLFAVLMISSSLSSSFLSNIVAYEATFVDNFVRSQQSLQYLADAGNITDMALLGRFHWAFYPDYNADTPWALQPPNGCNGSETRAKRCRFSDAQKGQLAKEVTDLLTGLSFQAANVDDDGYVVTNASTRSLDNLSANTTGLYAVPAYRLTTQCVPARVDADSFEVNYVDSFTTYAANWYVGNDTSAVAFNASYNGPISSTDLMQTNEVYFIAFEREQVDKPKRTRAILGYLIKSTDWPPGNLTTEWGTVPYSLVHLNNAMTNNTALEVRVWGLQCEIMREEGTVEYRRDGGQTPWSKSRDPFSPASAEDGEQEEAPKKQAVPSRLYDFQININYNSPVGFGPGIGPAVAEKARNLTCGPYGNSGCWPPVNMSVFASNYLYASAEAERLMYDIAASASDNASSSSTYSVPGTRAEQRYQVTYVPALLLGALVFLVVSAGVAAGMMTHSRDSAGGRAFRRVDVVRLLADCVVGLPGERVGLVEAESPSGEAAGRWADGLRVRYAVREEDEEVLELRRVLNLEHQTPEMGFVAGI